MNFQTMGWRSSALPLKTKLEPETLVFPMFLASTLAKTSVFPMFSSPSGRKNWKNPTKTKISKFMGWRSVVTVWTSWFFWLVLVLQCFRLLGLENIGKTSVFCSFSNYDLGSPAHSFSCLLFLLALPVFSAPRARNHWFYPCLLLMPLQ